MKKMFNFSDKVLISLAFLGDVAVGIYANSYRWRNRDFLEFVTGGKNSLRNSLYRLLKTGQMEKIIKKNNQPYFRLTSLGSRRIERLFPISKLTSSGWDKKWRVVIFDIPEKERKTRDFLRRKLVDLGFGELQKSVYISPLDVLRDLKEMLENYGLYGKVIVFEAKDIFSSDPKQVANLVWKLDELNLNYLHLIERINSVGDLKEEERVRELKRINEDFFNLALKDPFLPRELLPDNWVGGKVRILLGKLIIKN